MLAVAQIQISDILLLLAGLGVFLVGMKLMSDSMETLANNRLRSLLNSVTNNKWKGVGVGAATTAIIQSSSATTVMTVGFVNAGVLTLTQAVPIIMGANIGTTITAQLAALQNFPITEYITLLVIIGAFMSILCKKDKTRTLGIIFSGLGLLFIGLDLMSASMSAMRESTFFSETLQAITNPFLLILIGTVFTAIVQSSSAVTGILVSMTASGIIIGGGGNAILYVILGTNIGTCVTAILSSIGANTNGKRTAIIHLMFNVIGAIIFLIVLLCWPAFYDQVLVGLFPDASTTQIAMFHTMFNVVTTLLLLPFSSFLVKLSKIIVKGKKGDSDELRCKFIDERFLHTPAIAVAQTIKEVGNTVRISKQALDLSINSFTSRDYSKLDKFDDLKKQIKFYVNKTTKYLVDVSSEQLSYQDEKTIGSLYHALTDVERVTDLADNIKRYCKTTEEGGLVFSDSVITDVSKMHDKLTEQFDAVITTFESRDKSKLPEIEKREDEVDEFKRELLDSHIKRLNNGECNIESSSVFINLVNNIERVGDHLAKIARSVAE